MDSKFTNLKIYNNFIINNEQVLIILGSICFASVLLRFAYIYFERKKKKDDNKKVVNLLLKIL